MVSISLNVPLIRTCVCSEKPCEVPPDQQHGHHDDCDSPYKYGSHCSYECDSGFSLPPNAISVVQCVVKMGVDGITSLMEWDSLPSSCARMCHAIPTRSVVLQIFKVHVLAKSRHVSISRALDKPRASLSWCHPRSVARQVVKSC